MPPVVKTFSEEFCKIRCAKPACADGGRVVYWFRTDDEIAVPRLPGGARRGLRTARKRGVQNRRWPHGDPGGGF